MRVFSPLPNSVQRRRATSWCLMLLVVTGAGIGGAQAQLLPTQDPLRPSTSPLPNPLTDPTVPFGPKTDQFTNPAGPDAGPTTSAEPAPEFEPLPGLPNASFAPPSNTTLGNPATDPALQPLVEEFMPDPGQPLPKSEATLDRVLAEAATESTVMTEQTERVAASDASRFRSWMRYLPSVNAKYNVGLFDQIRQNGDAGNDIKFGGAYTVEATKPLYYWGALEATRQLAFLHEKIAKNEAIVAYAKLIVQIRAEYYHLVVERAQIELLTLQVESAQRKVDREKEMLAHGNSSPVTVANLDNARKVLALKLAIANGSFKNNIYAFKALSGVQNFNERDVPDSIALPKIDYKDLADEFAAFKKDGFATSVAAKTATLRHEAVDQQVIINDAAQKPNFNFGAGITQGPVQSNSKGNTGVEFQTIIFVGITGSWNLFDNYQTSDNNRKLLAQGRGIDAKLLGTRDQLFGGAENQLSKIETGLLAIDLYKDQILTDQENYKKELARHEIGQGDQVDVNFLRDAIYQAKYTILEYQASVAGAYYSFLTTIFRDPNLSNVDSYNRNP